MSEASIVVVEDGVEALIRAREAERHPARVYVAGLQSKHSRETMGSSLKKIAELRGRTIDDFPWTALDFAEIQVIKAELGELYEAHTTVNCMLSALRGVIRTAWKLGQIEGDRYQRLVSVANMKGERLLPGRCLSDGEFETLREAFLSMPDPYGAFQCGLLAIFRGCGLRRGEVCGLPLTSVKRDLLGVIGKGNKAREIPLTKRTLVDVVRWMDVRKTLGVQSSSLFVRVFRDDRVMDRAVSTDAMNPIVEEWGEIAAAGGEVQPITPHDLRRTFATSLLDQGVDLLIVQRLMGHASPITTARYDRRGIAAAKKALLEKGTY
jgi:integrase/recombinase XerD